LWGGVIGDDGHDGIDIGQGSPSGEAFREVQQLALEFRRHGIVLAVCSKNEEQVGRAPFQDHPDMILRENDIAVHRINWEDKATNLEIIAKTLSIGLDALVFLDDNPAERALVRSALPAVAVPELPTDPALYARTLRWAGYFDSVGFSDEDRMRAENYQANAKRMELRTQARDLNEYLRSLEMEISFAPFDEVGQLRIAQLINKSNQFHLTAKRYTESQLRALQADQSYFTIQTRLRDVFGDNGIISAVICRKESTSWLIDTWVMSCRVLGRRVEEAVLREITRHALDEGVRCIDGTFIATGRNELVRDHYRKLNFRLVNETADASEWRLELETYKTPDLPFGEDRGAPLIRTAAAAQ
jgi:FkbH-like protein